MLKLFKSIIWHNCIVGLFTGIITWGVTKNVILGIFIGIVAEMLSCLKEFINNKFNNKEV